VVEGFEDVGPPLVADRQPTEAGEPGERAFDNPAVPAQAFAALDPATRDARDDAPLAAGAAAAGVIVPFVGVQLARAFAGPAGALPDRRHGVEHRLQHGAVVHVRRGEQKSERDAGRFGQEVALAAGLGPVGRVRAGELAPPLAGKEALSSEQRDQSIALARPSRSSKTRWSSAHTPAFCQSRSRRQQVMPQPQPISRGSIARGMPLWSTKRIPANALRSSTGGRPPFGRGLGGGSSGATTAHSSSETSALAIEPL
jgi:hypothetical protein